MKPIKVLLLALVPVTGCLSTTDGGTLAAEEPSYMEVVLVTDESAAASIPQRAAPAAAPQASRRLVHQVDVELGGRARADLRLCVGGDGGVTSAAVIRSSGIAAFDDALLTAARDWRYVPLAAPEAQACHVARVSYRVR
jgi:TonB family protein